MTLTAVRNRVGLRLAAGRQGIDGVAMLRMRLAGDRLLTEVVGGGVVVVDVDGILMMGLMEDVVGSQVVDMRLVLRRGIEGMVGAVVRVVVVAVTVPNFVMHRLHGFLAGHSGGQGKW